MKNNAEHCSVAFSAVPNLPNVKNNAELRGAVQCSSAYSAALQCDCSATSVACSMAYHTVAHDTAVAMIKDSSVTQCMR